MKFARLLYIIPFIVFVALFFIAVIFRDSISLEPVADIRNVSFAIAFLGGVLSIFSPCTVAVLPAFISFAFKEKREISKMTAVFFLGFSLSFIALGLFIAYLGKLTFVYLQNSASDVNTSGLIMAIGFLLVLFGILTIFGKGFTFINLGFKPKHDVVGIFLFGAVFAVGWSACTGPIVAGILSVAAVFNNYAYSALLLFFYSLGIAIPLFFMAFAYDRYNLAESRLVKGREFSFSLLGHDFSIHTTKAVAGLMLVGLGILFIVFRGTTSLTNADLFGRLLVLALLLLFSYLLYIFVVKRLFPGDNARHIIFAFLFIGSVFLFFYLDSRFVLTTVGYAEFFDRIILQNNSVFNVIGIALLAGFGYLLWRLVISSREKY